MQQLRQPRPRALLSDPVTLAERLSEGLRGVALADHDSLGALARGTAQVHVYVEKGLARVKRGRRGWRGAETDTMGIGGLEGCDTRETAEEFGGTKVVKIGLMEVGFIGLLLFTRLIVLFTRSIRIV